MNVAAICTVHAAIIGNDTKEQCIVDVFLIGQGVTLCWIY